MSKKCALVLCTGNSCRSQMAEGLLRHDAGNRFDVYSAGTRPAEEVHPLAVQVMSELGIDISEQEPKGVAGYLGRLAVQDLIIVCEDAERNCPTAFPGAFNRHFWPFEDPAKFEGDEEATLNKFREVRDAIRKRIGEWLQESAPQE
ncbi:arsenate reductase ArsC [Calycomorphotria hydatis]|uniref:Arsenate-mycothiol transferase ArsC2 n=1 Tax=Calycomorphotria hydatis TaxID=2528027 RepID=A0A517T6F0_9PLAN|nr:arsenate reductase ArsC [Calycomorphotria hydatis]QDT63940.1 Arsenate-mycothiol transferase ArsC2 [Calycomorphotria hydatis]